jgi:hypothetical protein
VDRKSHGNVPSGQLRQFRATEVHFAGGVKRGLYRAESSQKIVLGAADKIAVQGQGRPSHAVDPPGSGQFCLVIIQVPARGVRAEQSAVHRKSKFSLVH